MKIYGVIKEAKGEKVLPNAKIRLLVGDKELACFYSGSNGQFNHQEASSYIGETLICRVEIDKYKPQEVTYNINEEEVALEIEMVPLKERLAEKEFKKKPPLKEHLEKKEFKKWPLIVFGIVVFIIIAAVTVYFMTNKPTENNKFYAAPTEMDKEEPEPPKIISFYADKTKVDKSQKVILYWQTANAQKLFLKINDGNLIELRGMSYRFITTINPTVCTLIAEDMNGLRISKTISIKLPGTPTVIIKNFPGTPMAKFPAPPPRKAKGRHDN